MGYADRLDQGAPVLVVVADELCDFRRGFDNRVRPELGEKTVLAEGLDHPAFGIIRRMLDGGRTWMKLSGAYFFGGPPAYAEARAATGGVGAGFGQMSIGYSKFEIERPENPNRKS